MRGLNRICFVCGEFKIIENPDTVTCSKCNRSSRKDEDEEIYKEIRLQYLKMCHRTRQVCPITETPIDIYSDIHHKKGRIGYADEEKKKAGISLLIDVDYFLAVSRTGHQWIETHPEKARKYGYSLTRMDVIT